MNRFRYISWVDLFLYGGLAVLCLVCAVWAALTPQDWDVGMIIALIGCTLGFVYVAGIVIVMIWGAIPNYITQQGVAVRTVTDKPTTGTLEPAIQFFIENVLPMQKQQVAEALDGVYIDWRSDILEIIGLGWVIRKAAGIQLGKYIRLTYADKMSETALFHELTHVVEEFVLNQAPSVDNSSDIIVAVEVLNHRYAAQCEQTVIKQIIK